MNDIKLKDLKLDYIRPDSSTAKKLSIHFRRNLISQHPAIIIGEDGKLYLFLSLTSHKISNSVKLKINPNPKKRNEESYVIFRMRANKKSAFSAPLNWTLTSSDYNLIIDYVNKKIK